MQEIGIVDDEDASEGIGTGETAASRHRDMEGAASATDCVYVLGGKSDPEERLENAILWKLVKDRLGDRVAALKGSDDVPTRTRHLFGHFSDMTLWMRRGDVAYPPHGYDPLYWTYPTFLRNAGREVEVASYEDAKALVADLHDRDRDVFVKATRQKALAMSVPRGETLEDAMGDYVYSFIDGGPKIIVQENVAMTWEYRLMVIDHAIVTGAGVIPSTTPYDNERTYDRKMRERGGCPVVDGAAEAARVEDYLAFAGGLLADLKRDGAPPDYTLDLCMIDGRPAVIEMNPCVLGRVGLYATDARALVAATLSSLGL